jgi:hypothetical protein
MGANLSHVSRAQRSMKRSAMMRCRPGIVTRTAFAAVPDQRCTASLTLALHRIRDTHVKVPPAGTARHQFVAPLFTPVAVEHASGRS